MVQKHNQNLFGYFLASSNKYYLKKSLYITVCCRHKYCVFSTPFLHKDAQITFFSCDVVYRIRCELLCIHCHYQSYDFLIPNNMLLVTSLRNMPRIGVSLIIGSRVSILNNMSLVTSLWNMPRIGVSLIIGSRVSIFSLWNMPLIGVSLIIGSRVSIFSSPGKHQTLSIFKS